MKLTTKIDINGTPKQVWTVLMKFDEYPEWNPFITKICGDTNPGRILEACIGGSRFKPVVQQNHEEVLFQWKGQLLFPGLFDGTHSFEIIDKHDGSIEFHHTEMFTGILVPLFKKYLNTTIADGFENMNKALKKRVEEHV